MIINSSNLATNLVIEKLGAKNVMKPMASWSFSILLDYLNAEISGQLPRLN